MAEKDRLSPEWRDHGVESTEENGAAAEQSTSRDALLIQSLANVSLQTRGALPPEGLEARLLARAAKQGLLRPASAASANPAPVDAPSRGLLPALQRWTWAPVALAAIALVLWIGSSQRQQTPAGVGSEPQVAGIEDRAASIPPQPEAVRQVGLTEVASQPKPKRKPLAARTATRPSPAPSKLAASTGEIAGESPQPLYSEFVPLEFASALPADDALQTVRVRMDADDFLRWSLPGSAIARATQLAHNGRVTADFLVGDDGSPRAIRLVSMDE